MESQPDTLMVVSLRRFTSDKPWGFGLQGGFDMGLPVFVHKITRSSIAHKAGLEPGDVIIKIGPTHCASFAHSQVKAEVLRAGNELDFTVKKRAFNVAAYTASSAPPTQIAVHRGNNRQQQKQQLASGEAASGAGGASPYRNVVPKTYRVLESQLPQSEGGGPVPASYRDRAIADHSAYIKAQGQTIQRAYGET